MKKPSQNIYFSFLITWIVLAFINSVSANDSSYFASGNQIIPLQETDISVKKEILTIKRIKNNKVRITVDYIFHNPKEEKSILMGFEAYSPQTEMDTAPKNGEHPYIKNFSVKINGKTISHKVSFFPSPNEDDDEEKKFYTKEELEKHQTIPKAEDIKEGNFAYIYHFPATFPTGETSVIHTYDYAISGAVYTVTSIDYLLTPALRWANKQIDDFTLIIDLGSLQQYHIYTTFFENLDNWETQGRVKIGMENVLNEMSGETERMMSVWQHHGSVTFHTKNFKPKGELSLFANRSFFNHEILDSKKLKLSLQGYPWMHDGLTLKDEFTRKVLENLPYARRGYGFKNKQLKAFFETQPWYMLDPDYKLPTLTTQEKEWLLELRSLKIDG